MISETTFIKNYISFWDEISPNAKDLVMEINGNADNFLLGQSIERDEPRFRSINNMLAYEHFKKMYSFGEDVNVEELFNQMLPIIRNFPRTNHIEYEIDNVQNRTCIFEMSERLIKQYKNEEITFYPSFNGCGSLSSCKGDLFYNKTLVELKAGKRHFIIEDIRQLLVYVLLNSAKKKMDIKYVELFNPRTNQYWKSSLTDFIIKASIIPFSDLVVEFSNYLYSLSSVRK